MRPLTGAAWLLAATAAWSPAMPAAGAAEPARSYGAWQPGPADTCPRELHDRYAVHSRDGRVYPGWHPPATIDPATGRRCSFGHEHGRDPRGSHLHRWLERRLGGVPFGAASEALDAFARANPGTPTRHEDHVGHKIEWANDVRLTVRVEGRRRPLRTTCDFLAKLHQGTHSADAFAANVHELIYAARCDDGTRLLTTTFARFGRPGSFQRACDPRVQVGAAPAPAFPAGPGARLIPDRACVERHLLAPAGRFSQLARGIYESWRSSNRLTTPGGRRIAYWNPHFAVFNPSRYHDPAAPRGIARTVDLCWERAGGRRVTGSSCDLATAYGQRPRLPFDDPRSPFDGSYRETYFNQTAISNRGGPRRWYTDPYGRHARRRPFPGALCQIVGRIDNRRPRPLAPRVFGGERPYGGRGVHAPN